MINRRRFLGAAAGSVVFCGCGLPQGHAAQPDPNSYRYDGYGTRHAPIVLAGKRVRVIDTHAHCFFHDANALLQRPADQPVKGAPEFYIPVSDPDAVDVRLKTMDAMGIDLAVLSVNPVWYAESRDVAAEIVRLNNLHLAELCAGYPRRFAAFASVSLQYPELAIEQLESAMKVPGFHGVAVGGSVVGVDFSDPRFDPFWARASDLNAVVFIHPQIIPALVSRLKGNGWLYNTIGNPLDTTIALQHLIFDGTLDRYPALKILAAHGGGYFGSYAPRSDHACFVAPANCNPDISLEKRPSEYLRQLHFDALVFTPEALRHLVAEVGVSQVMVGTDCPIPWEQHPVEHVLATKSLTANEQAAILGGNAERLLGLG